MLPKTEKELELYFKLQELFELKVCSEKTVLDLNDKILQQTICKPKYEKAKSEYLKLANQ